MQACCFYKMLHSHIQFYTIEYGCVEALAYVMQCVCAIPPPPPTIPSFMYLMELMHNDAIQYQGRDVYK